VCEREWEELRLLAYLVVKIMSGGVYQSMLVTGRKEKKVSREKTERKGGCKEQQKIGMENPQKKDSAHHVTAESRIACPRQPPVSEREGSCAEPDSGLSS
jgi:hypothetical protein